MAFNLRFKKLLGIYRDEKKCPSCFLLRTWSWSFHRLTSHAPSPSTPSFLLDIGIFIPSTKALSIDTYH
jgi:hypothetical protein